MMVNLKELALASAVALLVTGLWAGPVMADDDEEEENDEKAELQAPVVMVTANRMLQDLFELPMSVNVITEEDIRREPQTTVADLFTGIPGIMFSTTGVAGGNTISIRGEDAAKTLMMVNGVAVSDRRSDTASFSAITIDPSQIERIEIIKGPASVIYGSEAIGGVVNIITKKGGDKPISFSQRFVADSSTDSLSVQTALFGSHKGFNYRFSGSGVNSHKRKVPGEIPGAGSTSFSNRYYMGQVGYNWDKSSLSLNAENFKGKFIYSNGVAADMQVMRLPKMDRESLNLNYEIRDVTPYLSNLSFNLGTQTSDRDWWVVMAMVDTTIASQQEQLSGSVKSEWSLGKHRLVTGLDYVDDDLEVTYDNLRKIGLTKGHYRATMKADYGSVGIFAQDEWSLTNDWAVSLGLRQTWFDTKFKGGKGDTNIIPKPSQNSRKESGLVGNLGLVYSGLENTALRASWSQGYRFPNLGQLYLSTIGPGTSNTLPYQPNPDLEPETSDNYEIGARFDNGAWMLDAAAFYTDSHDFITTEEVNGVNQYVNADSTKTLGIETSLAYTFNEIGLTPYADVTWLRRETNYGNGVKTTKTRTPDFAGRVGFKWQGDVTPSQRLFTNLYVDWATKAESENKTSGAITEYPAWQTLNFTIGLEGGEEHKYNASLSLRNIGNQHYYTAKGSQNLPEAGFHIVLGLGFEY